MRLGGIDIGSNAVRLLVADITYNKATNEKWLKKIKLYRIPVRLGMDAFTKGKISPSLKKKLCDTLQAFRLIMKVYEVEDYRACATSALREASNSEDVIATVKKKTDVDIRIIDGKEEAELILANNVAASRMIDDRFYHLYVDVGGGSTEMSIIGKIGIVERRSFKIGTIRLLKEQVKPQKWDELKEWLQTHVAPLTPLSIIGSGGNINRVFKRSYNHKGQPLVYDYLKQERNLLATLSIEDRIKLQDLNRDRAEVIVPALDIFLFTMEHTSIRQVVVPKLGLADGIIRKLFDDTLIASK